MELGHWLRLGCRKRVRLPHRKQAFVSDRYPRWDLVP